jgi:hypothetical protein
MITATKLQVIFLSEIKTSKFTPIDITSRFNMHGSIVVPSRRRPGRLWLMWMKELLVCVHLEAFHLIFAVVKDKGSNCSFGLICVYGDPYHLYTSAIWEQVADFVNVNINLPMLCIGDMNDIMYDHDKTNANVNRSEILLKLLAFLTWVIVVRRTLGQIEDFLLRLYFKD